MVSDEVVAEFAYVGLMLKTATRQVLKEDGVRTGPTRTDIRDSQGPRQAPAGHAPRPPRRQPPRRASPPALPFGMSPGTWHDFKLACGWILLFAAAGIIFFGRLIGAASG